MKHFLIYLGAFFVIFVLAAVNVRILAGRADGWVCQDSQWVKHGNPAFPPSGICWNHQAFFDSVLKLKSETKPSTDIIVSEINVDSPASNQVITSPLEISGQALGAWYFEGSFPVKLIGDKGQVLAQGHVTAQSDWMSSGSVLFKGELNFNAGSSTIGVLVFSNDNPSGLPENEKDFGVPVRLSADQQVPVTVYFGNNDLNQDKSDCSQVFPVERLITKTPAMARASLEQLLIGTTDGENTQGYYSSVNQGVKINKLTIANGTAKVDFDSQIQYELGGSCRVAAIRAQIEKTLEQFPTVKKVVISVNGDVGGALQP